MPRPGQTLPYFGAGYALNAAMKTVFKTSGRSGGFITSTLIPANRTEMVRFGVADALVIATLLLGTAFVLAFVLTR